MEKAIQYPQKVALGFASKVEANLDIANGFCVAIIAALSLFGFISLKAGAGWMEGLIIGCSILFIAVATAVLLGRRVLIYSWGATWLLTGIGMAVSMLCMLILWKFY